MLFSVPQISLGSFSESSEQNEPKEFGCFVDPYHALDLGR